MPVYPSIYKAKAVQATSTSITAFIPQVFGDVPVVIEDFLGPAASGTGWVFFQAGNPEHPVWTSRITGVGGGPAGPAADFSGVEGKITALEASLAAAKIAANEVHIGTDEPTDTAKELWYDTEPAPGELKVKITSPQGETSWQPAVTDEVHVGIAAPVNPNIELWYDPDASVPLTVPVAWAGLPFTNGWSNYLAGTWTPGAYRKIGDIVYLRGLISRAAGDATGLIATMPSGFRPPASHMFACISNGGLVRVDVNGDGTVMLNSGPAGYGAWTSLAQIFFSVTT